MIYAHGLILIIAVILEKYWKILLMCVMKRHVRVFSPTLRKKFEKLEANLFNTKLFIDITILHLDSIEWAYLKMTYVGSVKRNVAHMFMHCGGVLDSFPYGGMS